MKIFLSLSLLSGMLELGAVLWAFTEGLPIWAVLSMALMYQLGNLLCIPGKTRPRLAVWLGLANLALYGAGLWMENTAFTPVWPLPPSLCLRALQIALSSLCIQTVRGEYKAACPTWLKRTFRIAGFVLAPLMVSFPHAGMLLCILLPLGAALSESKAPAPAEPVRDSSPAPKGLSATMILHQMHYFVYTYIMPLTVAALTDSIYAAAALYGLTWVVYLLPQRLEKRLTDRLYRTLFFLLCHGALALTMLLLNEAFSLGNIRLGLAAWLLTGLGGGSVFCIKYLTPLSQKRNMPLSENIGHFLGTAAAVLIALNMSKGPEDLQSLLMGAAGLGATLTIYSCIFVMLTLLTALGLCSKHLLKEPRVKKAKLSKQGEKNDLIMQKCCTAEHGTQEISGQSSFEPNQPPQDPSGE